jgi:ribosome biogenesis GTPase A
MTKAIRMMQKEMSVVDSIIYVLDARAPLSSINPKFDEIINQKPILYILNKADMVPKTEILKWQQLFEKEGKMCLMTDSTQKGGSKKIVESLVKINSDMLERYKSRGISKSIRAMVIGVPNCGKSTLINSLVAKNKTVTGNKPGVTRGKQWVSIDRYIDLLDTPGTLYPDFEDQHKARNLAFIGSINDDVLDIVELAAEMLTFLNENYPEALAERYKLESFSQDMAQNLEFIGRRRGLIIRGGEVDIEKTAKAIIQDFRKQAFGKLILEKV